MFKFIIDRLEDVSEEVRKFYKKNAEGKYQLDVDGVVAKERLDEFRENNISMKQQLDALKDIDPKRYQELLALDQKVREKQLIEAGKIDELVDGRVKAMREENSKVVKGLKEELSIATRQLETLLIDNAVKSAAIAAGVLPAAIDDVVLRAKNVFSLEKGLPVMKDAKGEIVYGEDGKNPMSVADWTKGLVKSAPHLFQGSQGSGATGGKGGQPTGGGNMTAVQKIEAGLATLRPSGT